MKWYFRLICMLMLALAPGMAFSQAAEDDENDVPEIAAWRGGNMNFGFRLGMDMLGSSIGTGSLGGLISPAMNSGAASITRNPAELAFNNNRHHVLFDGNFALGTRRYGPLQTLVLDEINSTIQTETDAILNDPDQVDFVAGGFRSYTNMKSLDLDINSRYPSFAVSVPLHKHFVAAISSHRPLDMAFRMDLTGFQVKLAQEQGSDDVSLRFDILMNVGMVTDIRLNMHAFNAGFGSLIFDRPDWGKLGAGFTYSHYTVSNTRFIDADLSGMVVVSSADERFFNNPNDPNLNLAGGESNSLLVRARGTYRDSGAGYRFGLYYKAPRILGVSLVYNQMPSFTLSDPNAFGEAFLPVFVEGDDLFEDKIKVDLNNLQAAKPNLTTRRNMGNLVDGARLSIPTTLTLGLDLSLGAHNIVLNYTNYQGELALAYGDKSSFGKAATHGAGLGLDFKMKDRLAGWNYALIPVRLLFLDFDGILMQSLRKYTAYSNPRYRFGVNTVLGEGIATGAFEDMKSMLDLPLPTGLALGRTYRVFNSTDVGFTMFGFPDLLFKFSVGFSFY